MLILTKKKKNVFSKLADVVKYQLDTRPEYVKTTRFFDETQPIPQDLQNPIVNHEILIKVPIDKVSAIKNDVKFIEGFFCEDSSFLRVRSQTFAGFGRKNMRHLNYAIHNKDRLARKNLRSRERKANLQKAFSVDINSTMLASIKVDDVLKGTKTLEEIFGTTEHFSVSNIRPVPSFISQVPLSSLRHLAGNLGTSKELSFFPVVEIEKRKNDENVMTRKAFQRKYCAMHRAGMDPAVPISRSKYKSQSMEQMTQGTIPKDFQTDRASESKFAKDFHKMIDFELEISKDHSPIKREKKSKHHEILEVKITITDKIIKAYGGSNAIDIVIFAKNKLGGKIDYNIISVNLEKLIVRKRKQDACQDVNNYSIQCKRATGNRLIIKAINHTSQDAIFTVEQAQIDSYSKISGFNFENFTAGAIPAGVGGYIVHPSTAPRIGQEQGYFYRAKPRYADMSFDNTKFFNVIPVARKKSASSASIYTQNDVYPDAPDSITIYLNDLPEDALGCNVVKRNLTKNEKEFKVIKNLRQVTNSRTQESFLDLKNHTSRFFGKTDGDESFRFVDEDVEVGDTYEYKALIYESNCTPVLSINSCETTYEKRSKIVDIRLKSSSMKSSEATGIDLSKYNSKRFVYEFIVNIEEDSIDRLFNSLDRNTFDLFSKDLSDIRESIKKNVSCIVKLLNTSSGEVIEVGKFSVDQKKKSFKAEFDVEDLYSTHVLIVEPRVASISHVVDNLLEKMENLPAIQSLLPISTFSRNLNMIKRQKRRSTRLLSSVSVGKYASKSVRFFSLILDPITRFNLEKDDFYYEGTTGDNRTFEVYDPEESMGSPRLSMRNVVDLSKLSDKVSHKYSKNTILSIICSESQTFVDFYCFYTKSAGTTTFQGMIAPDDPRDSKRNYNFSLDMTGELGLVEVFYVSVLKNGNISKPTKLTNLICTHNSVRKL